MNLGWQELTVLLVIVLIVFGAGRLPTVMRSFGQGVKEFRAEAEGDVALAGSAAAPAGTLTNAAVSERDAI